MYHFGVKRVVCRVYERLNQADYEYLLKRCAVRLQYGHTSFGSYSLGGTRHTVDGMRRFFQRLFQVLPGLHFEIKEILVRGWPWNTVVAVVLNERVTTRDGHLYTNDAVEILRLRWGRAIGIHFFYLDPLKREVLCQSLARQGISEAAAPPIED